MGSEDSAREQDQRMMRRAIARARQGRPSPGPPRGAVLISAEGKVIAEATSTASEPRAASLKVLDEAGDAAKGGTLYLSFEPDNAEDLDDSPVAGILRSGIKRVVIGATLPEGSGHEGATDRFRGAGLTVEAEVLAAEAVAVVAPWIKHRKTGRPHVSLKLALSLDGRIASRAGVSKWITGPEARVKVQQLRSLHDAVAVGIGTALADNPLLTVRDQALLAGGAPPLRIVFDTKLRTPTDARVVDDKASTLICTGEDAPEENERALIDVGCTVMRVAQTAEGRIDMIAALEQIGATGVVSMLVEGGAELAGTLIAGKLADELHAFIAPLMLGPRGRPGVVDWAGPETPEDAPRVKEPSWEVCGQDAYVHGWLDYTPRG